MSKYQFTGTATQPQCNRKFCQFNKDQYCRMKQNIMMILKFYKVMVSMNGVCTFLNFDIRLSVYDIRIKDEQVTLAPEYGTHSIIVINHTWHVIALNQCFINTEPSLWQFHYNKQHEHGFSIYSNQLLQWCNELILLQYVLNTRSPMLSG